jgi:hypothetical protein
MSQVRSEIVHLIVRLRSLRHSKRTTHRVPHLGAGNGQGLTSPNIQTRDDHVKYQEYV